MKTPTIYRVAFGIFAGLLIYLPLAAHAAFITDKIEVEVRTERFGQGAILTKLSSGSSVEVLVADGQYSRIRTTNNITGWVNSTFLTNKKPTQLEYLELLAKSKGTEAKLKAAEEKLAGGTEADSASTGNEEIERLKNEAKDARWMKVEMMKARDRADQAEAKLKASGKKSGDNKQALEKLRTQNKDLEKRLAAAMLVNKQQEEDHAEKAVTLESMIESSSQPPIQESDNDTQNDGWTVGMEWFFGSLFTALLIGFVAGISWLDKRSRQRHGGFRIY